MSINSLQPTLRGATGKELQFTGDFHAYWDQLGIPPGQFAERMVAWKALPQNAAWIDATEDADAAEVVAGLWKNGEQGAWYDPSDLSTMFQDAAGTLPVYMPGQGQVDPPVGLLLDKRLGLARGPELLVNGEFTTDSGWTKNAGWGISGGAAVRVPDATVSTLTQNIALSGGKAYVVTYSISSISAGSVTPRLSGGTTVSGTTRVSAGVYTEILFAAAGNTRLELYAAAITNTVIDSISVRELPGNHAYQATTTSRPTLSARYNLLTASETLATQNVTTAATSYSLIFSGTGSVALSGTATGTYSAGSRTITCTAGTLTITVTGNVTKADIRPTGDGVGLPAYQRVVDANTYDTVGFPLYLRFDGVDDFLQTASVDFSGTDKALVAAAARKLSDAATGCLVELSVWSGVSGAISIQAPRTAGGNLAVGLRDASNVAQYSINNVASPASVVLSAKLVISAVGIDNQIAVRVNGGLPSLSVSSPATVVASAFANAPLYIGRRAGTSQPFNGLLYSLLIRGAATPDATIATVERYLNSKARAY